MFSLRTISLSVSLLLCLILTVSNADDSFDCGEPTAGVPRFTQLAVFPNPVQVGQTVHVRAVVVLPALNNQTLNGSLTMEIKYQGTPVPIPGISLCDSTDAIVCSALTAGQNAISFDYEVPQIPEGDYTITLYGPTSSFVSSGCLTFTVTVEDPTQNGKFLSYLRAELAGSAQFSNPDYTKRQIGDIVQIGPIGSVPTSVSSAYAWGTFISVEGTQDNILSDVVTTGLVWGLSGNMTTMKYSQTLRAQTYTGTFYVGYVNAYTQHALTTAVLDGDFSLTWTYTQTASGTVTTLQGELTLNEMAVLPTGWSDPLVYQRLGPFTVYTSTEGILTVNGSEKICTSGSACDFDATVSNPSKKLLTSADVGLIIAFGVGVPLIITLAVVTILYLRRRRSFEEEDGIFSASRKPEYGNALVVDDIIQETREHSPELIPRLNRHPGDYSDDEYERRGRRSRRNSRRETSMSRSRTPSRSESLSPSPSRSESRSASASRSRSRSRSYSEDYSSDGSSASRD